MARPVCIPTSLAPRHSGRLLHCAMLDEVKKLIELFAARAHDRNTLDELHAMIGDRHTWDMAHGLFTASARRRWRLRSAETSAQRVSIFSRRRARRRSPSLPGDPEASTRDSPYWIVPNALSLAR